MTADNWKFHQSKTGTWWVWDGTSKITCLKVKISIAWDKMFGKPDIRISEELINKSALIDLLEWLE